MKQKKRNKRYFWYWVLIALAPELSFADSRATEVAMATKAAADNAMMEQRLLNANRYILLKNAEKIGECRLSLSYGLKNELIVENAPIAKSDCETLMSARSARFKMTEFRQSILDAPLAPETVEYLELVREAYVNFYPLENYNKEFTIAAKGGESPIEN